VAAVAGKEDPCMFERIKSDPSLVGGKDPRSVGQASTSITTNDKRFRYGRRGRGQELKPPLKGRPWKNLFQREGCPLILERGVFFYRRP